MAKNNNLTDFLINIADAIRINKGITDKINPQSFIEQIYSLKGLPIPSTYISTNDLPTFIKNIADSLRELLNISNLINPQDFYDLILQITPYKTNKSDWTPGDIILYDSSDDSFCALPLLQYANGWDIKKKEITGVLVVPSTHTSDGTARIISTKYMNCSTPASGSDSPQNMYYGTNVFPYYIDSNSNYIGIWAADRYPVLKDMTSTYSGDFSLTGIQTSGSEMEGGNVLCHIGEPYLDLTISDNGSIPRYYDSVYNSILRAPCPYAEDGISPYYDEDGNEYGQTWALSDFDGEYNTNVILQYRGSLSNNPTPTTASHFPSATCCDKYSAPGKSSGNWYLPSIGELSYISPYAKNIITSLNTITPGLIDITSDIWLRASTQNSETMSWAVNLKCGGLYSKSKTTGIPVMAFCKI